MRTLGYVSFADLAQLVRDNQPNIPRDVDLIVGIPRSGMVPAYMIGLYSNRLVTDLDSFAENRPTSHGQWRAIGVDLSSLHEARSILLVDDSCLTGAAMQSAAQRIRDAHYSGRIVTCAAIVVPSMTYQIDIHFLAMPVPRLFEWNVTHHSIVENSCFDLDGVLCADPTDSQNDDGPNYNSFLLSARALLRPSGRIGHVVSARLEKYREPTEAWLAANDIRYGALHLVDLHSAAERTRLGAHSIHKAKVYRKTGAELFFESDLEQARQIARLSAKPVLCTTTMTMHYGSALDPRTAIPAARWHLRRPLGRIKGRLRRLLGA